MSYPLEKRELIAEAQGLRMQILTLAAGQEVPWHWHSEVTDTFWCMDGPMVIEMRAPRENVELAPGQMHAVPPGFSAPDGWEQYMTDSFETLLAEGRAGAPKMMSVGLHCRLIGRPGRAAALARFLDRVAATPDVWVCRRADIARHWLAQHPPKA